VQWRVIRAVFPNSQVVAYLDRSKCVIAELMSGGRSECCGVIPFCDGPGG